MFFFLAFLFFLHTVRKKLPNITNNAVETNEYTLYKNGKINVFQKIYICVQFAFYSHAVHREVDGSSRPMILWQKMYTNYGNPSVHGKMCKAAHCGVLFDSVLCVCFRCIRAVRKSGKSKWFFCLCLFRQCAI